MPVRRVSDTRTVRQGGGYPYEWFGGNSLCYVAAGRFDAWLEAFLGKWDFSAAALIVQEAGGRVTDFYGNAGFIDGHHVVATNGWLHPFLLELVQKRCL